METTLQQLRRHEIPGHVAIAPGNGGLPKVSLTTKWSTAEIYLHGAHVTGFQKQGEPPLIWMSRESIFAPDKAIRGGVPICFPWFGSREGFPAHGLVRLVTWELIKTTALPDGSVSVGFQLPKNVGGANAFLGRVEFIVTVNEKLTMELIVTNTTGEALSFETCLHTYFTVGDINEVAITGLKGTTYLDKVDDWARKQETNDAIRIAAEVDRVFPDSAGTVEIHDAKLRRVIRVEKTGSVSTVVWNPWIAKSKAMPDFGGEEYKQMICVESGNVGLNKITLAPGKSTTLKAALSSQPR